MNETILSEILRYLPEINAFYDCRFIYTCFLAQSALSTCSIYQQMSLTSYDASFLLHG